MNTGRTDNGSSPPTVTPGVSYRDAPASIRWLVEVLEMRQGLVVDGPGGTVAHAELWWQDAAVFVETREASGEVVNAGRSVVCLVARDDAEVDRIYQRALSAHTHVELPRGDTAFGSHQFALRDAENNIWTIGTYQPVPPG